MKTRTIGCVILFLLVRLAFATFSSVLDETLQNFREKVLGFQRFSLITLDESFFKFYDLLYGKINASIIHRQFLLKEEFNLSCSNFPIHNLEPDEARRLKAQKNTWNSSCKPTIKIRLVSRLSWKVS